LLSKFYILHYIIGKLPKAAFAVVVENSMDKNLKDLCEEILNDFQTEQMIRAVGGG
jgi:hypothetical protein